MFKMSIETGNAAFDDGNAAAELARMLGKLARQFERDTIAEGQQGHLWDVNGNIVGTWTFDNES